MVMSFKVRINRATEVARYDVDLDIDTRPHEAAAYGKVTRRLLPILMVCYLAAYLDRVNIGFARLQMLADLRFSETVYGLGAGMFFVGYFLFEVPSNLMLHRVGARLWIGRIMLSWALVSAAFMFVRTPLMFYSLRFLLGVAEAGFFPGIILYLTYWYPSARRARIMALFMIAIPVSGIAGGPLSGWILERFAGVYGLTGWLWHFLLVALPALVMGIVVMLLLDNGIRAARWLSEDEKRLLERNLEADASTIPVHGSLGAVARDRRLWRMCLIYFACVVGQYGLTFWLPVLVQSAGVRDVLTIGILTAVPYAAAVVAMVVVSRSADARRERRWHTAGPMLAGAAALLASVAAGTHTSIAMICLSNAAAGIRTSAPLFWSLPTAILRDAAAAAGIAAINSVGNLGGFASPYLIGALKDATHGTAAGLFAVSAVLVAGAILILRTPARLVNR
jgi:MFS family permease